MSRAYTKEESREILLDAIHGIAKYWATVDKPIDWVCNGVAFSILALIDGCNPGIPALDMALSPHPDDKEYLEDRGENWYEPGMVINDDAMLHEMWHKEE